jgi:hypothetical protein
MHATTGCSCGEPPDAPALWEHAAEDRGPAVANRIGRAPSGADFDDEKGSSENSVGNAPVSGVLCQRESDLAHRRAVESPLDSKPGSDFAFDRPLGIGDTEKRLKMEIPANS